MATAKKSTKKSNKNTTTLNNGAFVLVATFCVLIGILIGYLIAYLTF